jgi:hypothetical protein
MREFGDLVPAFIAGILAAELARCFVAFVRRFIGTWKDL